MIQKNRFGENERFAEVRDISRIGNNDGYRYGCYISNRSYFCPTFMKGISGMKILCFRSHSRFVFAGVFQSFYLVICSSVKLSCLRGISEKLFQMLYLPWIVRQYTLCSNAVLLGFLDTL